MNFRGAFREQIEREAPDVLRLGFEPLGTYLLLPWPTVAFGTFFASRDGRVFAGIDHWQQMRTRLEAVSFMSVLEDGTFFETAGLEDPSPGDESAAPIVFQYLPGATAEQLQVAHEQGLGNLEQKTGKLAMRFRSEQFREVSSYGHLLINHEAHRKGLKEEPPEATVPRGFVPDVAEA